MAKQPKVIADVYPLVVIIWEDHTAKADNTWWEKEDMEQLGVLRTTSSVGWLYKETNETYVVAACIDENLECYGAVQTIGKAMVRNLKVIKGKMKK